MPRIRVKVRVTVTIIRVRRRSAVFNLVGIRDEVRVRVEFGMKARVRM